MALQHNHPIYYIHVYCIWHGYVQFFKFYNNFDITMGFPRNAKQLQMYQTVRKAFGSGNELM